MKKHTPPPTRVPRPKGSQKLTVPRNYGTGRWDGKTKARMHTMTKGAPAPGGKGKR